MDFVQSIRELTALVEELEAIYREHIFARKRCIHHMDKIIEGDVWACLCYRGAKLRMGELDERAAEIEKRISEIEQVQLEIMTGQENEGHDIVIDVGDKV